MRNIKVINRKTGKVEKFDAKNVKSYTKPSDIEKLRADAQHALFSFVIEFKGLGFCLGMYQVDEWDLVEE